MTKLESAPVFLSVLLLLGAADTIRAEEARKPNVILIMTDDQGYGDLSCHGNPTLKTPNLDRLHSESVRLTDFHVSPFCTPTRAALMTGRYPARTGAYRTSSGRTLMHPEEETIANLFAENGYATAMIGKWHLGDNAPHRPQDRGFQHVVWHRCGGVWQASDYWGNDYFDDTYERNGKFEKFQGYCTDIWFSEATRFIEENKKRPFFLYLATSAPHGPYRVDPEWSKPYADKANWGNGPQFYGMVANIDHNLGSLRQRLRSLGLDENTILIFMTDNGTANGAVFGEDRLNSEAVEGFNAGMRGKKSSIYDGGHRVPFFIHWPNGGLVDGRDVDTLAAHLDVLPTLADLCGLPVPASHQPDGRSFAAQLRDAAAPPHRDHLLIQFHGGPGFDTSPAPWAFSAVLADRWRLIDGEKLYDIEKDPAQRDDVSAAHPRVVENLRAFYMPWWESVSPRMVPVASDLGNPRHDPTTLSSQDWYLPTGNPPWNFGQIKRLPRVLGPWYVDIKQAGLYRFTLRQWPAESGKPIQAVRARMQIAGLEREMVVTPGAAGVVFELELPAEPAQLRTWFYDKNNNAGGAYFADVDFVQQ